MNDFKKRLGNNAHELPDYEFRALRYAETYGIITYQVKGNKMRWKETHKLDVFGHTKVYRYELDLDSYESKCLNPDIPQNIQEMDR